MDILIFFFIFLFGLIIGSFINCLIWRLHKKESILGRSYCPKCKKQIAWHDNIPILSFLFLKGKCRHCRQKISWQYPAVELVTGILFVLAFIVNFPAPGWFALGGQFSIINYIKLIRDLFIIAVMVIVFIYDLRWYLILDAVTLPAAAVVFILNLMLGFSLFNLLISGIIGGSFFLLQFIVSKGKWIGGGDIRLGLLMGVILGWPLVLAAIFLAYFIGSFVGLGLIILKKKTWGAKIPLGIFLSSATVLVLFWGSEIFDWYLNLFIFY